MRQRNPYAALIGIIALVIASCSAGEGTTTTDSSPGPDSANSGGTTTTEAQTTDAIHSIDSELGTILVDGEGFTLYVFTADTDGVSTCYEGCVSVWPPVDAGSEIGSDLDSSMFGGAARTDGSEQLTVNGQPLYRYAPDANPGDISGQGVGGVWFVVDSNGSMVGAPEASNNSGTEPIDDGYDY